MPVKDYDIQAAAAAGERFFVITGCSGGGKSTLIEALGQKGFVVVPEPGRQIVREQLMIGGDALPSLNPLRFVELALSRTIQQRVEAAGGEGIVFLDRAPVDSMAYLERLDIEVPSWLEKAVSLFRQNRRVFVVPPWPEIFVNDAERLHSFEDAVAEYDCLVETYERLGYELTVLPPMSVAERVRVILELLPVSCTG